MTTFLAVSVIAVLVSSISCNQYRPDASKISDYDNYKEDKSYIGKEIACTAEEKECYKLGRVLYTDGKCYMLAHVGPCKELELHFSREKARNGEFKPECQPAFKCGTPNEMYMAYDGICYQSELIHEVCDVHKNLTVSQNLFGEIHCRCFGDGCPPRPAVSQPEEPGRCRLPDLIHEGFPYWHDNLRGRLFPCSAEEHACLKQGTMLHEGTGACHRLLERGPCPEGQQFVADRAAFQERGWLLGRCAPPSCPDGHVRMQFDGQCYPLDVALNKICPPHILVRDVFGDSGCGFDQDLDVSKHLPRDVTAKGECYKPQRGF
ncbi:Protein of unknown function [Gryllus bimaculatus]|nr:Protein of unknown function [Gryllus bimaculatus]